MATQAAKDATSTVPIVFAIAGDAVASGFVKSFEHPGGNITGVPDSGPRMSSMRLEVLKEALPHVQRVAIIGDSTPAQQASAKRNLELAASKLGLSLLFGTIRSGKDLPGAFELAASWGADAFVTMQQTLTSNEQNQILELAAKAKRPLLFHRAEGPENGALLSLGDDADEIFRSAAGYVARVLKGESPATMALQPSSKPELIINLKTAKALGLTIAPAVLKKATRVIQ